MDWAQQLVREKYGDRFARQEFSRGELSARARHLDSVYTDRLGDGVPGLGDDGQHPGLMRSSENESPVAVVRRISRLVGLDHDVLDDLDSKDEFWREMDHDAIVDGARRQLSSAIAASTLEFDGGSEDTVRFAKEIWKRGGTTFNSLLLALVDSYTRGFTLTEELWTRFLTGDFRGRRLIRTFRRLEDTEYRLVEDVFGRPSELEVEFLREDQRVQDFVHRGIGSRVAGGTVPNNLDSLVLTPQSPLWNIYQMLTTPEDFPRALGDGAYIKAFPHYYFGLHVAQWLRALIERHGTPTILGVAPGFQSSLVGAYAVTEAQVMKALENIQLFYRGLLPPGYDAKVLNVGLEGLAQALREIFMWNRSLVEIAIIHQQVTSGAEASLGTKGANEVVTNTFLRLVTDLAQRFAALINKHTERMVVANFGAGAPVPTAVIKTPDPLAEEAKLAKVERGILSKVINKDEPWLRAEFGAPELSDKDIQKMIERRRQFADANIGGEGGDPLVVRDILDQAREGLGDVAVRAMLRTALPDSTPDELNEIIAEARALPPPARGGPVETPFNGTGFEFVADEDDPFAVAHLARANLARRLGQEARMSDASSPEWQEVVVAMEGAVRNLGERFSETYDTRKQPPVLRAFQRALSKVVTGKEADGAARLLRERAKQMIEYGLPDCEPADLVEALVDCLAAEPAIRATLEEATACAT